MEEERFEFSPLRPILLVLATPAIYYFLSEKINALIFHFQWFGLFVLFCIALYYWRYVRITFLMLRLRPAVILTAEAITITEKNYTINWKDVMDVYLANDGPTMGTAPRNYYVIIRVRESEKYIKVIKNPFTRYFRWYTRNWRPSPFEVDLTLVKGDKDEIYHTVLRYYQNNRGF